jgi:hypothetical protein
MVTPSFARRIFLSHAEEDSEIAHNVEQLLKRKLGVDVRLDKLFLDPGDTWRSKISMELKNSELFILLHSRTAAIAPGVQDELSEARRLGLPVIVGVIRNHRPTPPLSDYQLIDFGKNGQSEEAACQVARFLLNRSHPFAPIGLLAVHKNKSDAIKIHGCTESLAKKAKRIVVFGHSFKEWLGDYGSWIAQGKARVELYFPASNAIGMDLLKATHHTGRKITEAIESRKTDALTVSKELQKKGKGDKLACYEIPMKPMFSAMAVDPEEEKGFITVDHFLVRVSSENRPKLDLFRQESPLFRMYWQILEELIHTAKPLTF